MLITAIWEPIEMSIQPDTLMKVMLHATVPIIAAYNPMFKRFLAERKWGEVREKKITSRKRAPHTVIIEETSPDDKEFFNFPLISIFITSVL